MYKLLNTSRSSSECFQVIILITFFYMLEIKNGTLVTITEVQLQDIRTESLEIT